jgi:hypothetical protein
MSDNRTDWQRHVEDVKGHTLLRDEDGAIDIFVEDFGNHNGPGCVTCGEKWCHHCFQAEEVAPCDGGEEKRARDEEKAALDRLHAAAPDLLEALKDALAGWRYIREHHGDLYGVGWDRVEEAARAAIARATGEAG